MKSIRIAVPLTLVLAACGGGTATTTTTDTPNTTALATTTIAPTTTTGATTGTWFDGVTAGMCFDDVFTDTGDFDFSVAAQIVPCASEHDNEVVAVLSLGENDYPDDPAARADTACALAHADFLGRPIGTTLLLPFNVVPSEEDWAAGAHDAVCAIYTGDPMIGTARSGDLTVPGEALALLVIDGGTQQLWVVDAGTGEVVADLTPPESPEPSGTPAWTPDSSGLAVSAPGGAGNADILLINITTAESLVLVASTGNDEGPAIAPFGAVVAYTSDVEGPEYDLFVFDLATETTQHLTSDPGREVSADWSPDGDRIAFRGRTDENSDVYVIDLDSEEVTRLTDDPGFDGDPRWSPDGSQILFTSDRGGSFDLWVMNPDGSNQTQLTDHPSAEEYPTWSRDGRFVAYHTNRLGFPQVWVMRADGSDQSLLVGAYPSAYPSFGPPGALDFIG